MSCLRTMPEVPRSYAALEKHSRSIFQQLCFYDTSFADQITSNWKHTHTHTHLFHFKIHGLWIANFCCYKITSHPGKHVVRASDPARQSRSNKLFIDFRLYQSLWKSFFDFWPVAFRPSSSDRRSNHLLAVILSADSSIKATDHSLPAFHQEPADPPNPPDPVSVTANHDAFWSTLPFTLCIQRNPQPQNGC